jgi:hypothetical protein
MDSIEQAFDNSENAAKSALQSATNLVKLSRRLQKAAKEGNIAVIKKSRGGFNDALENLTQVVADAVQSWPYGDEEVEEYLKGGYTEELRRAASEMGLEIHERDKQLISHPSTLRILTEDEAVRIDNKKISTIKPSYLVDLLIANQRKRSRFSAKRFLEALYKVYSELVNEDSSDGLMTGGSGRVVLLARIYRLFTSLPGSGRDYAQIDFARDLYQLETSGVSKTTSGASIFFHASTGTRGARNVFTFVGPHGQDIKYYGIRFTRDD